MDHAAKKLWLDALRSRKYRQGRGQLCSADGKMCCLGVLIDATQDGEWELGHGCQGIDKCYAYDGSFGLLSESVRQQVNISQHDMHRLADLNDRDRWSFRKIADHIELNL